MSTLQVGESGFATIQAAIDASANGDTISVTGGTYLEQLTVSSRSNLTIVADSGAVVTVQSTPTLAVNGTSQHFSSTPNVRAVIAVNDSTNITIKGLSIDGAYAGDTTSGGNGDEFSGIAYLRSSGSVDQVNVTRVSNSTSGGLFGLQHGDGILIDGQGATGGDPAVSVTNSTVSHFQKTGVLVTHANATLDGNTITGEGATDLTGQNGIQFGNSLGTISNNTIQAYGYTGPNYTSSGVILFEQTGAVAITDNTIIGAFASGTEGIDLSDTQGGAVTISGNLLAQLQYGIYAYTYRGGTIGLDSSVRFDTNVFASITIEGVHFAPEESYGAPFSTTNPVIVSGTRFADTLRGSDGDDVLVGLRGNDTLFGGGGNDRLDGGSGSDMLTGGAGRDTFAFSAASDSTGAAPDAITDFETGLDKLDVSALGSGEAVSVTRNGASSVVTYRASTGATGTIQVSGVLQGYDLVTAGSRTITLTGSNGADFLVGSNGADTINGGGGGDSIVGGAGADFLTGGAGGDTFSYNSVTDSNAAGYDTITDFATGADRIDLSAVGAGGTITIDRGTASSVVSFAGASGPAGVISVAGGVQTADIIAADNTRFFISGSSADETISGSAASDVLLGNGGNDRLIGGSGADRLAGGAGADTFIFSAVTDSNGAGFDTITDFTTGVDRIDVSALGARGAVSISLGGGSSVVGFQAATGAAGFLVATGAVNGSDLITGANTVLYIAGSDAGETIVGSAGMDVITGGGGRDFLTGGAGADIFRYTSVSDSTQDAYDGITDFATGVDKIDLSALGGGEVSINQYGAQSVVSYAGPSGGPAGVILLNGVIHQADFITGGATLFHGG